MRMTLHILLAEDDKNFGFILKKELEEEEHTVDLVHDGVEAVLMFLKKEYDVLLFDIRMPKLDGINALRIIRKIKSEIPAITFSGNAGNDDREKAAQAGSEMCLTKPFEVNKVKEYLRKISL
jgi:CheY-like chemotaxis protein